MAVQPFLRDTLWWCMSLSPVAQVYFARGDPAHKAPEVSASGGSDLPLGLVPPCRADHHCDHHDSVTGAIILVVVKARGRIAAYGNPSYSKNTGLSGSPEGFPVSDRVLCALDSIKPV